MFYLIELSANTVQTTLAVSKGMCNLLVCVFLQIKNTQNDG